MPEREDVRLDAHYQRSLEVQAVIVLFILMALSAISFASGAGANALEQVSDDLTLIFRMPIIVTPNTFAVISTAGAALCLYCLTPSFRRQRRRKKQSLFVLAGLPIFLYTFPVGWNLIRMGMPSIAPIVYIVIFGTVCVIARAVYRS